MEAEKLPVQGMRSASQTGRVLALGEILWDVFESSTRLGGAPLNFAAHVSRLGHETLVVSALGNDELGRSARAEIEALGLDTRFIQATSRFPTGTASVQCGPNGQTAFQIQRPAAYDVELAEQQVQWLSVWAPEWLYYGTLFPSTEQARNTLRRLICALPGAARFYDVNLRPKSYSGELVLELLGLANVVKLNETEMEAVAKIADLPLSGTVEFCSAGARRYGWQAACITLGARGCAILDCRRVRGSGRIPDRGRGHGGSGRWLRRCVAARSGSAVAARRNRCVCESGWGCCQHLQDRSSRWTPEW
jgi:fructokinase